MYDNKMYNKKQIILIISNTFIMLVMNICLTNMNISYKNLILKCND